MTFLRRLLSSSPLLVDLQQVIIGLTSLVTCPTSNCNVQPHLYLLFTDTRYVIILYLVLMLQNKAV